MNLRTTAHEYKAAWLRQHRRKPGVSYIIYINRMPDYLSGLNMQEHGAINESGVKCINTIPEIFATVIKMLRNNFTVLIGGSFFKGRNGKAG